MAAQPDLLTPSVFEPAIATLPSGHSGLARDLVATSQRQRLLHSLVVTVAGQGYAASTIDHIAARAGVSKKTFYVHFPDKQACFLAAYELGRSAMLAGIDEAAQRALADGADAGTQLRMTTAAFVDFVVREAFYARVFFLETLAVGAAAVAAQLECRAGFSARLHAWHTYARRAHPEWPAAGPLAYEAATGAVHELTLARVATGRTAELPEALDELVAVQLGVLRVPD